MQSATDSSTGGILASNLTGNEDGDASQVGPLPGQIPGPFAPVTAGGAYNGKPACRAVAGRQPDPSVAVAIPPRARPRRRVQPPAPHPACPEDQGKGRLPGAEPDGQTWPTGVAVGLPEMAPNYRHTSAT